MNLTFHGAAQSGTSSRGAWLQGRYPCHVSHQGPAGGLAQGRAHIQMMEAERAAASA
ncbi:MAG: hypothetical protein LBE30_03245 [Comamonas sp.]|nr:hypothetical protein [Comamonas sp.]